MLDSKVYSASQFKMMFDAQFLKPKMQIKCMDKQWAELVSKEIESFEQSNQFKEMEWNILGYRFTHLSQKVVISCLVQSLECLYDQ